MFLVGTISGVIWGTASQPTATSQDDSLTPPKIVRGPYGRVQDVATLILYRNQSPQAADWVYSPEKGPFRALGDRIATIIAENKPTDPVYRLNEALYSLNLEIFNKISNWLEKGGTFPALPPYHYANFSKLGNESGSPLMSRALNACLDDISKLGDIDQLLALGVNINKPFIDNESLSLNTYRIPPLTAAWLKLTSNLNREETIVAVADHLLAKGADLNQIVDDAGNNVVSFILPHCPPLKTLFNWYLKHNGDINFQNKAGNTYLHLLLKGGPGSNEGLKWFMDLPNVDFSLANADGEHPIHFLIKFQCAGCYPENEALLKFLLEKAPQERFAKDGHGHSLLYFCTALGDLLSLQTILQAWDDHPADAPLDLVNAMIGLFSQGSHYSVADQQTKLEATFFPIMNLLLPYLGKDAHERRHVFIQKEQKATPLHYIAKECPWLIDSMLKANIIEAEDLDIQDQSGVSVKALATQMTNNYELIDACYSLKKDKVLHLISQMERPDVLDSSFNILLHAVLAGLNNSDSRPSDEECQAILNTVVQLGIDLNDYNRNGETPLFTAIRYCGLSYAYTLLNCGADPSKPNADGTTIQDLINYLKQDPGAGASQKESYRFLEEAIKGLSV